MDFRYEVKNETRNLHKQRRAFIIMNNELEFLPKNSPMSHFEYCNSKGLTKDEFNKITRGYYLNGNVVFYEDNFIYNEKVIEEALRFLDKISSEISVNEFAIYFGHKPEENFALDLYYGRYVSGSIIKMTP